MREHAIVHLYDASESHYVGGKASALGKLLRAGVRVPDGFVVTAGTDRHITVEVNAKILQKYDQMKCTFVAVRSSAIGEDSKGAAWAGQLDTFLNTTRQQLLTTIHKCFQSIHSDRAQSYAIQKNMTAGSVSVIVQQMIQSDISGVAFSMHPITNDHNTILIEAGYGLGEAVVSGEITPDSYVVSKMTYAIVQQNIVEQEAMLTQNSTGETIWKTIHALEAKLSTYQIQTLARVITYIESIFGYPVDVEWAFENEVLYILQSRPITTIAL